MINIITAVAVKAPVSIQAHVVVDADTNAERVLVMNRNTGEVYHLFKFGSAKTRTFRVPKGHELNDTLLVGVLDDDGQYNCAFADGRRADAVNVNA